MGRQMLAVLTRGLAPWLKEGIKMMEEAVVLLIEMRDCFKKSLPSRTFRKIKVRTKDVQLKMFCQRHNGQLITAL